MAKGGKRAGAGNPGYPRINAVVDGVEKLTPKWFELAGKWLNGKDKLLQRTAFTELSKLMAKTIPQEVGGLDGSPIEIKLIDYEPTRTPIQVRS